MDNKSIFVDNIKNNMYPPRCLFCSNIVSVDEWGNIICDYCKKNIYYLGDNVCKFCGNKLKNGEVCPKCFDDIKYFEKAVSLFYYTDIREGIIDFKFRNIKSNGIYFGKMMAYFLKDVYSSWINTFDCIVAVPMHNIKRKRRGYNQSEILATTISDIIDIPYDFTLIFKKRKTLSQTKITDITRIENIKDSFRAENCKGLRILLVDDVYTTGSTANECSKVLMKAGAKEVFVFTLALS